MFHNTQCTPLSKTSAALNCMLAALGAFSVYGYWADFVPSPEWADTGLILSIGFAIVAIAFFFWAVATGRHRMQEGISEGRKIFSLLMVAVLLSFMSWAAITHGVGSIATRVFGVKKTVSVQLRKHDLSGSRLCKYRVQGAAIEQAFPSCLCFSASAFRSMPKTAAFELHIDEAYFGFHIVDLKPEETR